MTNLSEEVSTINKYIDTIEKFKAESFYRHVEAIYEKFKEVSLWIAANKPAEIFKCEESNEGGYFYTFYCKDKKILDNFVDKFESLFHY